MLGIHPADALWSFIVLPILVLLVVVAVRQIIRDENLSGHAKVLWIAVVMVFPLLGMIAWIVCGYRQKQPSSYGDAGAT